MSALEELEATSFSQPYASTSRAVFTLPYKPVEVDEEEEERSFELYDEAWDKCSTKIHSILSTLHDESLDQIVQFVADSQDDSLVLEAALTGRSPLRTGLIIGGSPGSSSFLYSALCRQLTELKNGKESEGGEEDDKAATCLVSRFTSRDCSNIKSAMRSLISGFLGSTPTDVDDEDDDEEGPNVTQGKASFLAPEDILNLVAWYNHHYRRNNSKSNGPTLVILIEDLEAMNAQVLSQMISILSHFVDVLPLALLIGVATSSTALFNAIPRPTANLLHATTFFVEPGVGAFTSLIRGLFIDWLPPLALGPKVYQYIWKTFEDSHHSIDATVSAIQYIYIHHFTTKPYSQATFSLESQLIDQPDALVTAIKKLPSVIEFFDSESQTTDEAPSDNFMAALQSNESEIFFQAVEQCRFVRDQWQNSLRNGFEMLLLIQSSWQRVEPMEKLLLMLSEVTLVGYSNDLCNMILNTNSTKLMNFLERASVTYSSGDTDQPCAQELDLRVLKELLARPRASSTERINLINDNVPGSNFMHGDSLNQNDREFSQLVRDISGKLREALRIAFAPSTGILLHELWFANETAPLKRFHPSILPTFHNALIKEPTGSDEMTDVAVAYRLYRDTGKTINLGDWWMAFDVSAKNEEKVVVENDGEEDGEMNGNSPSKKGKGKGKQKNKRQRAEVEEDEEEEESEDEEDGPIRRKQARFLRALGDLAYVGFLQPTTRKSEHVLKSVF